MRRGGAHLDRRVDEAGGADHLLGEDAAGLIQLPAAGRRRDVDGLRPHGVPFLESHRPVVHAGGQAEAVFGQRGLALVVAAEHAADLRHGHVALVDEHQGVVGQVFEQGRRRLAGFAPGEVARIVLDAGAGAGGLDHLEVEQRALLEPLRLQQAPRAMQLGEALLQLLLDAAIGLFQRRLRRDVVGVGVDLDHAELVGLRPGQGIELDQALDLVAEQRETPGAVVQVGGPELDGVAAHAERAAYEVRVVPPVLKRHEIGHQLPLLDLVATLQAEGHGRVGLDRADTVDARHAGHDDDVVALDQRAGRRMAHAVDLLVDGRVLLDIGVGARDIGFRLVVVVVGDEILDRVVREEALELAIELGGERLVGGEDERRALGRLDHLGHGEGLAGAGDAKQHLVALMRVHLGHELGDGARLIALGLELGLDVEGDAAFGLLGARRAVGREVGDGPGHQRVLLNQRLRRLAKARRAAVGTERQTAGFAGDGARLGAGAEGLGHLAGHCRNMAAGRGLG